MYIVISQLHLSLDLLVAGLEIYQSETLLDEDMPLYIHKGITSVDITRLDYLCDYSKTRVLCGQCQSNLSVLFGITDCKTFGY